MSFHLAGLHWNPLKYEGIETAKIILKTLERHSIEYTLDEPLATYLGLPNKTDLISGFANVDLLIILGGDGTILRSLDDCVPAGIPILGVNLGRLGFLTEVERDCVAADLEQVLNNNYYIEEDTFICLFYFITKVFAIILLIIITNFEIYNLSRFNETNENDNEVNFERLMKEKN